MLKVRTKVDSKWGGIASKSGRDKNVGNYFWIILWLNYQTSSCPQWDLWLGLAFFHKSSTLQCLGELPSSQQKHATGRGALNGNHALGLEELFNSSGTVTFKGGYFIPRCCLESKLKPTAPFYAFCHQKLCWCIQGSEWGFGWFGESETRLLHVFMFWFRIRMDLT